MIERAFKCASVQRTGSHWKQIPERPQALIEKPPPSLVAIASQMPNIDTYPSKYYKYLETQRRVSKWVEKSGSMTNGSISQVPRPGSKRKLTSESADALIHYESTSIHRGSSKRHNSNKPRRYSEARDEKTEISPAFALVSSSFFVWALLPSILTLSAFVVILSFASLDDKVCSLSSTLQLVSDISIDVSETPRRGQGGQ